MKSLSLYAVAILLVATIVTGLLSGVNSMIQPHSGYFDGIWILASNGNIWAIMSMLLTAFLMLVVIVNAIKWAYAKFVDKEPNL